MCRQFDPASGHQNFKTQSIGWVFFFWSLKQTVSVLCPNFLRRTHQIAQCARMRQQMCGRQAGITLRHRHALPTPRLFQHCNRHAALYQPACPYVPKIAYVVSQHKIYGVAAACPTLGRVDNQLLKRILRHKMADARQKHSPMPSISECFQHGRCRFRTDLLFRIFRVGTL